MIKAACIEVTSVSNITVRDSGKCTNIVNDERVDHKRVQVDGCFDNEGLLADWIIERDNRAIIIELKGRHVEHGANQIFATAEIWKQSYPDAKFAGLIVGRQTPAANTSMQIKKRQFSKKYKGPLHVVKSNCNLVFDDIFSFNGPHKS